MLKPVNDFQHASEADGAGIAHVVNRWLQIKSKWAEMREADQFPDIPWDDIDAIFKARLDKQTYDIHWIADALRPDTTGPNSKLPPSVFARVQEYLQKQLKNDNEYHRALSEFTHFRMRTGGPDGLFNKHSAVYDDGFKPAMAWQCLLNQGSILARVAVKVMNTLANSVPSERSFSAISFIHTKARNRLTPMHADMQAFIFMNDRVLDRLKDQKYAHKKHWADLEEKDWLELEDSYLELFVNAQGKKVWMDGVMASANGDFEWEGVLQSSGDILGVGTWNQWFEIRMAGDQDRENTRIRSYCLKRKEEICMVKFCTYKKVVRTNNCLKYSTYVRVQKIESLLALPLPLHMLTDFKPTSARSGREEALTCDSRDPR